MSADVRSMNRASEVREQNAEGRRQRHAGLGRQKAEGRTQKAERSVTRGTQPSEGGRQNAEVNISVTRPRVISDF